MAGAPAKSQDTLLTQTADTVSAVAGKVGEVLNVGGSISAKEEGQGAVPENAIYVDEKSGSDSTGTGTSSSPYLTPLQALICAYPSETSSALESRPIYILKSTIDSSSPSAAQWTPLSGAAFKKAKKGLETHYKKQKKLEENKDQLEKEEREKVVREKLRREEAKGVILVEPTEGGRAEKVKLGNLSPSNRNTRIRVFGWVHRLRIQKDLTFLTLRDGTGYLQIILSGQLTKTLDALDLVTECSIEVTGLLKEVMEGKTAPGGHELEGDWWRMIGRAPKGEDAYASLFNEKSDASTRQQLRHLDLRGNTPSSILRVRSSILRAFRSYFERNSILEVTPPCIVQTSVEGGSSLFKFDYYGQEAYLTQSSQLYLETALPSLGDVFCVQESFRAENSHTRRHLSEYTHLEAELCFITFDDLLVHLEDLICSVVDTVLADPIISTLIHELNPNFVAPKRPFMRLDYKDAIKYLNEKGIMFPEEDKDAPGGIRERDHVIGDDIAEAAERKMTDDLGVPIFMYGFPAHLKSFYMKKMAAGPNDNGMDFTESVDVLMPNVGEIVGGSMRISDMAELMAGYKREGIPAEPYYWFSDQRKYGTTEHGGYGLGVERFIAWLTNRWTVRECQLYPRWPGHAAP